jgi:hypothetical protein
MNDLESVCIGDFYMPQPKQQAFHESTARSPDPSSWNAGPRIRNRSLTVPSVLAPLRVHLA